jgi:hypothetical protein
MPSPVQAAPSGDWSGANHLPVRAGASGWRSGACSCQEAFQKASSRGSRSPSPPSAAVRRWSSRPDAHPDPGTDARGAQGGARAYAGRPRVPSHSCGRREWLGENRTSRRPGPGRDRHEDSGLARAPRRPTGRVKLPHGALPPARLVARRRGSPAGPARVRGRSSLAGHRRPRADALPSAGDDRHARRHRLRAPAALCLPSRRRPPRSPHRAGAVGS